MPFQHFLYENMFFEFGSVVLQGWPDNHAQNASLRRSIVAFSWSNSGHSQGIFMDDVDGILVEECVLDHNGHYPGQASPTKFNHNAYIQKRNSDVTFINNITARASSHGFQLRPHGIAKGNLSIANGLAGYVSFNNGAPGATQV